MNPAVIIGISAVTGGGKTAVALRLTEVLEDAVALHFDDYDDTNVHPVDLQRLVLLTEQTTMPTRPRSLPITCGRLKAGRTHPLSDWERARVGPAKYVVADAPLGRAHSDSGRFIDLMVFIDTPLDVAMARRILRDIDRQKRTDSDEALHYVKDELSGYLAQARPIYEEFQERMRASVRRDRRRDPKHRRHCREDTFRGGGAFPQPTCGWAQRIRKRPLTVLLCPRRGGR